MPATEFFRLTHIASIGKYIKAFRVLLAHDDVNAVAFALVDIPLISYLVATDMTRAAVAALHAWIRSRRRRDVATLVVASVLTQMLGRCELGGEAEAVLRLSRLTLPCSASNFVTLTSISSALCADWAFTTTDGRVPTPIPRRTSRMHR